MAEIELNEKWILVNGPTIEEDTYNRCMARKFNVRATVYLAAERNRMPRESQRNLEICKINIPIPSINLFLYLPEIRIGHAEFWNIPVLKEKIISIMRGFCAQPHEAFIEGALSFLIKRVCGEEKIMKLASGAALKGNLWHDAQSGDEVKILGKIVRGKKEEPEVLYAFKIAGGFPPVYVLHHRAKIERVGGRHPLWCQKLATLVAQYVWELAWYMSDNTLRCGLNQHGEEIETSGKWEKSVAGIYVNLLAVPPDLHGKLIFELGLVGEKLGLKLV